MTNLSGHNHEPQCCCPRVHDELLVCPQCPEHGELASLSRATIKARQINCTCEQIDVTTTTDTDRQTMRGRTDPACVAHGCTCKMGPQANAHLTICRLMAGHPLFDPDDTLATTAPCGCTWAAIYMRGHTRPCRQETDAGDPWGWRQAVDPNN